MKHIQKEITIGKGEDITVLGSASVDGRSIYEEREGDSLLYGFLYQLFAHVIGGAQYSELDNQYLTREPRTYLTSGRANGTFRAGVHDGHYDIDSWIEISSVSGDPLSVSVDGSGNFHHAHTFISNSNIVAIQIIGASGNTDLNGIHTDFTINDDNTITLNQVSSTGSEDISNAYVTELFKFWSMHRMDSHTSGNEPALTRANLVLGRDSTANDIGMEVLQDPIIEDRNSDTPGTLQYNPQTINEPEINLAQQISTIKITREVQNNSGSDITAREIGIIAGFKQEDGWGTNDHGWNSTLIARDVINVTISNGSTVSFSYSIRTKSETSGGVMTNFNEILYRLLGLNSRAVKDINNQEQSANVDDDRRSYHDQYRLYTSPKGIRGTSGHAGILVGSGTQSVDEANFDLDNRHPLGSNAGQLFPLGTAVQPFSLDENNNNTSFDVTTVFENRSGSSIDINELGLFADTRGTSNSNPAMIMRHLTSQTETISNGEAFSVTYTVKLSV